MVYSLTDKLKFEANPQMELKGRVITINAEAETALKMLDILETEGEMKATMKVADLLFSEEDKAYIDSLKLSMADYGTLLSTAMDLCIGNDPDADKKSE